MMRRLASLLLAGALAGGCAHVPPAAPTAYVYGCVPVAVNSTGTYPVAVHLHNPHATAATVTRQLLNKDGTNLAGTPNPNGGNFPGEADATTTTIPAGHTATITWSQVAGDPATLAGNLPATVKVTSNLPLAGTVNITFRNYHPFPCSQVRP